MAITTSWAPERDSITDGWVVMRYSVDFFLTIESCQEDGETVVYPSEQEAYEVARRLNAQTD